MAPMDAKRNFSNAIIHIIRELTALLCIAALVPGDALAARTPPSAQTQSSATPTAQPAAKLPPDQSGLRTWGTPSSRGKTTSWMPCGACARRQVTRGI